MPSDVPTPASVPAPPLANERAEALLDQAGERLGRWSSAAYFQLRKTVALVREEAEDIWAEAQAMRSGSETLTTQPQAESEPA